MPVLLMTLGASFVGLRATARAVCRLSLPILQLDVSKRWYVCVSFVVTLLWLLASVSDIPPPPQPPPPPTQHCVIPCLTLFLLHIYADTAAFG